MTAIMISDVDECARTTSALIEQFDRQRGSFAVAVDLEGANLGAHHDGRFAIVTVCTPDGTVYLYDVASMQQDAFEQGSLKDLLEHPLIPKLWFDCRADSAELFKYGVRPKCVVDLQVSAVQKYTPRAEFMMGLTKSLGKLGLISAAEQSVKEEGVKLFAPEKGGSCDVFFQPPLDAALVRYCTVDAKHLFTAREKLRTLKPFATRVAEMRIARYSATGFVRDPSMVKKDF